MSSVWRATAGTLAQSSGSLVHLKGRAACGVILRWQMLGWCEDSEQLWLHRFTPECPPACALQHCAAQERDPCQKCSRPPTGAHRWRIHCSLLWVKKKYYLDLVIRAVWKILNTVLVAAEVTDHTERWDYVWPWTQSTGVENYVEGMCTIDSVQHVRLSISQSWSLYKNSINCLLI